VIGFRGYGQRDPLNEYKAEGFELFQALLGNLRRTVTGQLAHVEIQQRPPEPPPLPAGEAHHIDPTTGEDEMAALNGGGQLARPAPRPKRDPTDPGTWGKVGRNERCPCGSGRKYKQCHGAVVQV
jgi:preprotein translocase subunit SecA